MKKFVLFAAFAALVLTSCTKESGTGFESNVRTVQFTASSVDTKTVFGTPDDSTYPVLWSDNDAQVGIALNLKAILSADVTVSADHKTATFSREVDDDGSGMYQFVVVNPYAAFKSVNATERKIMVEVPSGQACTATTPDERSQVMVGLSDVSAALPDQVSLNLKHVPVYLHMVFTNVALGGAAVQSVNISSGKNIAGRFFYKQDGSIEEGPAMLKSISVNPETLDNVWCSIAPVDLSGSALTVSIVTDKGSLVKTLSIPSGKEFKSGKIFKMTVDMSGVTMAEPVVYELVTSEDALHWGDRVIIVAAEYDFAMSTAQNTNNRSGTGITKGDGVIIDPSESVEVLRLEDGTVPGTWSLFATGGVNDGYLYAAAGYDNKGNYLRTQNDVDELASWNISFGDFTTADQAAPDAERAIIKATVPNRPLMRYNVESNLFSAYGETTSMYPIKIYRLKGAPDNTPRFNVLTDADGSTLVSNGGTVSVNVFGNVAWTASATGGASLDKTSGNGNGVITVTIPQNDGASVKNYTVTVSTSAGVSPSSYTFSLSQAPYVSIAVDDVLLSESFAAGATGDTPSAYQESGSVSTVVFGGASVTYTQSGTNAKLYDDGLVYVDSSYDKSQVPAEINMKNLMVPKSGGWWKVEGIPCPGVKVANVVFYGNYEKLPALSSDTAGVTVGDNNQTKYLKIGSDSKYVYVKSYDITFDDSFAGGTFNLTFLNSNTSNNSRITDIKITVKELK